MSSESVIADFVATFDSDVLRTTDPVKGRVLLSEKRLVFVVRDDDKLTVPLASVVDVGVGQVPEDLDGFFDSTVTVAFESNGARRVVVEGGDEQITKFSTLLFRALLNGTELTVRHPASVGGRVTDAPFEPAGVFLKPRTVEFRRPDELVEVRLATVTRFNRTRREIAGSMRPAIDVYHAPSGRALLTQVATPSPRKLSLLGRYLRLEYADLMAELADVALSDDEKELLVAVYSGAGREGMSLPQILGKEPAEVTLLLNDLAAAEFVVDGPDGTALTPKGQVLVNRHFEDVNA